MIIYLTINGIECAISHAKYINVRIQKAGTSRGLPGMCNIMWFLTGRLLPWPCR